MLIPAKIAKELSFADRIILATRLGTYAETGSSSKRFLVQWEIEYFFNGKHYTTIAKAGEGKMASLIEVE